MQRRNARLARLINEKILLQKNLRPTFYPEKHRKKGWPQTLALTDNDAGKTV
jgi:hypothetical protein